MYDRIVKYPKKQSFFLFGPRGTGKSTWTRAQFGDAVFIDLLESGVYLDLLARPERLETFIPRGFDGWVVLDEIQKVPALLDEVHRLIERKRQRFVMTGSSARKLRRQGVNLLAGRALTLHMHPLCAAELGGDFSLEEALSFGHLPGVRQSTDRRAFLASYVQTYLREEVLQEGLTRNLGAFARFLEAASMSQGCILNASSVARECSVDRKVVEDYFTVLEDLLLAVRLPVFSKKAKRALVRHPKFYFFDAGVFRAIRPRGPLDAPELIDGAALETLVLQELRAVNDSLQLGYEISYWHARDQLEVDFVLYGERGLVAIEVKRTGRVRPEDLRGLKAFLSDYPSARAIFLYGGERVLQIDDVIDVVPIARFLTEATERL